ncbi:MAG: hypothetical protein QW734_04000 [Candidatus Bathyarchaeia archaeon]
MVVALASQIIDILPKEEVKRVSMLVTWIDDADAKRLIENHIQSQTLFFFPIGDEQAAIQLAKLVDDRLGLGGRLQQYARIRSVSFAPVDYAIIFSPDRPDRGFLWVDIREVDIREAD